MKTIRHLLEIGFDTSDFPSLLLEVNQSDEWTCVICDVLLKLAQNRAILKEVDIATYMSNHFCEIFPISLKSTCNRFIEQIGPFLIQYASDKYNADFICRKAGACQAKYEQCHIDGTSNPSPSYSLLPSLFSFKNNKQYSTFVAPWNWLIELYGSVGTDNSPIVDLDKDGFSTYANLRGYNFRGKDCNDLLADVYPGVKNY